MRADTGADAAAGVDAGAGVVTDPGADEVAGAGAGVSADADADAGASAGTMGVIAAGTRGPAAFFSRSSRWAR